MCGNHIRSLVTQTKPDLIILTGDIIYGNSLSLDGELLSRLGLECAAFHDLSDPACVFKLV